MIYVEIIPPQRGAHGESSNIVPRPEKWSREYLIHCLLMFLGQELGGTLSFIMREGQHLANEAPGTPETMENGYFLINPKTMRVMAFISEGAFDLLKSEKTIDMGSFLQNTKNNIVS